MMNDFPDLASLVPHRAPMLVIDRVIAGEHDVVRTEVTIRRDSVFYVPGWGVPAYVGFEMMAQTICAYDGLIRWRAGQQPAPGFLLGCRRYAATREWFKVGERYEIETRSLLDSGQTGSFESSIFDATGVEVAVSRVSVFRPSDLDSYLDQERSA